MCRRPACRRAGSRAASPDSGAARPRRRRAGRRAASRRGALPPAPAVPHSGAVLRPCELRCPGRTAGPGWASRYPAAHPSARGSVPILVAASPIRLPPGRPARGRPAGAPGSVRCAPGSLRAAAPRRAIATTPPGPRKGGSTASWGAPVRESPRGGCGCRPGTLRCCPRSPAGATGRPHPRAAAPEVGRA